MAQTMTIASTISCSPTEALLPLSANKSPTYLRHEQAMAARSRHKREKRSAKHLSRRNRIRIRRYDISGLSVADNTAMTLAVLEESPMLYLLPFSFSETSTIQLYCSRKNRHRLEPTFTQYVSNFVEKKRKTMPFRLFSQLCI
ncbi:hypothetical protein [Geobacillus sp. Y412MC52]|uniref:hypothetical protein n=1 Tax=Geobacillus sp. (strain Y412MC52) TaxID=550542 RepID=UPI001185D814|nr:hypothetical protein [Geobacillus sp. Y412MC52]